MLQKYGISLARYCPALAARQTHVNDYCNSVGWVLMSGDAEYLSSVLCEQLLDVGHEVTIVDIQNR